MREHAAARRAACCGGIARCRLKSDTLEERRAWTEVSD